MSTAADEALTRLRGQLRNSSANRQFFRLTRAEAEALAALDISESKSRHPSMQNTTPTQEESK